MKNRVLVPAVVALVTLAGAAPAAGLAPPPPWYYEPAQPAAWKPAPAPSWRPPAARPAEKPSQQAPAQGGGTERPTKGTGSSGPAPQADYRSTLVRLLNDERAAADCPALRPHPKLNKAAQAHSAYMARAQNLSHTGEGGTDPGGRLAAAGYDFGRAGENIVAGPADPAAAVRAWMNSSKHRTSILTCQYRHAGAGRATGRNGPWWTLLLAAPR
ncbi:CAP domain-containing protein [Streptomyces kurssanovii]|uniref:CAP domain-containing protein n=1 Tax=Streptomyces kurssanovii TaxID=67312 RepID=A0ABV3I1I9_9ACTN